MALARGRRLRGTQEAWPGYVDVLSTLVMVVVFVLAVFVLAQFLLANALSGKDKALQQITRQLAELGALLSLEQRANQDLRASIGQLSASLTEATAGRDAALAALAPLRDAQAAGQRLIGEAEAARDAALAQLAPLRAAQAESEAALAAARQRIVTLEDDLKRTADRLVANSAALESEKTLGEAARSQVDLLNRQLLALRQQLARVEAALEASEARDREAQTQISDLGRRLNLALAARVEELARYRSEFFGRLREALGNRQDIEIVGDRFVFRSEVLFNSGSADFSLAGRVQLTILADALKDIAAKIPANLPWVLRVDGHTDRVPIRTAQFPTNWELSTARATAVVKYLIDLGLPPDRLAAAGFGEFQPRDPREGAEANARNRRIEFKLTDR